MAAAERPPEHRDRYGVSGTRVGAARRRRFRPGVEPLEGRTAPAVALATGVGLVPASALVATTRAPAASTFLDDFQWLSAVGQVVLDTSLPAEAVSRAAWRVAHGAPTRAAILGLLQTPEARLAVTQLAYRHLLGKSATSAELAAAGLGSARLGDLRLSLVRVAAGPEYFARFRNDPQTYRAAVAADLLGTAALPGALARRPVETAAERLALIRAVAHTARFRQVWAGQLAGLALSQGSFPPLLTRATFRDLAVPWGSLLALARLLATPQSRLDVEQRGVSPSATPVSTGNPVNLSFLTNRQGLVPDPLTDPAAYGDTPTSTPLPFPPIGSPWGNSVVFPVVPYAAVMAGNAPQPVLTLPGTLPTEWSSSSSLTFSAWFQAKSPGSLLSETLGVNNDKVTAPLIYINASGKLVAGLFDQSPLPVTAGQTLLTWEATAGLTGGETNAEFAQVGAAFPVVSQSSVVDNTWHHLAFVVSEGKQALYLDGVLQGEVAPEKGSSYSFTPTVTDGRTATGPAAFQVGGTTAPEPTGVPYPQINYPQGFVGTIDEVAAFSVALTQAQVQQAMDAPVAAATPALPGLIDYFNFNAAAGPGGTWANAANAANGQAHGAGLVQVVTTVPTDPFPGATRLPGGRAWGLHLMTPLASPTINLNPGPASQYKVGLAAGDQLGISVPDATPGRLTVTVTNDVGATSTATVVGGASVYVRAPRTGTYQLSLTWAPANSGATTATFALVPGSLNSLVELLTSYKHTGAQDVVYQWAYADPSLPGVNPSAGNQAGATAAASYWPLWTDTSRFPVPSGTSPSDWAAALSDAYAKLVHDSLELGGSFANLIGEPTTNPTGMHSVQSILDNAYRAAYTTNPPTPPSPGMPFPVTPPPAAPQDSVYEFFYNANLLRQSAYAVLTGTGSSSNPTNLPAWIQGVLNTVNVNASVPLGIATTIAVGQAQQVQEVPVNFPNPATQTAGQVIGQAVAWALGGALAAAFGLPGFDMPILGGVLGGAGASLIGSFIGEAGVPSNIGLTVPVGAVTTNIVNATKLVDLATNVTDAFSSQWNNILTALNDTKFIQSVLSNYGLLEALGSISGVPLNAPALAPSDAISTVLARASWKAMVPAVFHWVPTSPADFPTANGQTTLLTGQPVSLGGQRGPYGMASGDFNGDGKLDLAVANYSSSDISILLGNGDGTFHATPRLSLLGGQGAREVVAGDFNGDGKLDLAVACYSSSDVYTLLGNGDGTFAPAVKISLRGGGGAESLVSADFNGDGKLDLAVACYSTSDVYTLLGNGDGTFAPAVKLSLRGGTGAQDVVTGDFNGDGKPDLAVSNARSSTLSVLLGNGDGTFAPAAKISLEGGHAPQGLVAADLNGDGKLDLATADTPDSQLRILYGNGDGTFQQTPQVINLPSGYQPTAVIALPVKGSKVPSLAVAYNQTVVGRFYVQHYSGLGVYFSNGNGLSVTPAFYSTDQSTVFQGLVAGDFRGDGLADLVVSNVSTDHLTYFSGRSVGNFATFVPGSDPGTLLGLLGPLQGGNAVSVGPYNRTSLISPKPPIAPPHYLGAISLPFAPSFGSLNITSPGYFLSVTPVTLQESTRLFKYSDAGTFLTGWTLVDANHNPIPTSTLSQLFGAPVPDSSVGPNAYKGVALSPVDPAHPIAGLNGGYYYDAAPAPGASATWADAFFNWGGGSTAYTPGQLIPSFTPSVGSGSVSGTLAGTSESFSSDLTYSLTFTPATTAPSAASLAVTAAPATATAAALTPPHLPDRSKRGGSVLAFRV